MNSVKDKELKKYSTISNVIYTFRGVAKFKFIIIPLMMVTTICTIGVNYIWLILSKYIIDYIQNGMGISELIRMIIVLSVLNIMFMIGKSVSRYYLEPEISYIRPMFMLQRMKKNFDLKYEELEKDDIMTMIEKANRSTVGSTDGVEGIVRYSINTCENLVTCIVAVVLLFRVSPLLVLFTMIFGVLSFFIIDQTASRDKKIIQDGLSYNMRKIRYFDIVTTDFEYAKDIRVYGMKDYLSQKHRKVHDEVHKEICKSKNMWLECWIKNAFITFFREGMMYTYFTYQMLYKEMQIGNFTLYVGTVRNLAVAFTEFLKNISDIRKASRQVSDMRGFMDYCENDELDTTVIHDSDKYEFIFENVSFKYPGTERYSLKNVNIKISNKERLAVVGANGAGKTTFIKLLCRLYNPTEGRILLNNVDITSYSISDYYKIFAPVFQDIECFAFSIAENVSMKRHEDMNREEIYESLKKAGLGDKIEELHIGIDTPLLKFLREDGIDLSGGEKQKLAFARALYKGAPATILDEPTSALDALAESQMYENFDMLIGQKTSIYISHRLSSTRFCDKIALFDKGLLVEYGTHDELMKKQGEYANMFEVQAQYYKEEGREAV